MSKQIVPTLNTNLLFISTYINKSKIKIRTFESEPLEVNFWLRLNKFNFYRFSFSLDLKSNQVYGFGLSLVQCPTYNIIGNFAI